MTTSRTARVTDLIARLIRVVHLSEQVTIPQIMHAVAIAHQRLAFPRDGALTAHVTYFELAEVCVPHAPRAERPYRLRSSAVRTAGKLEASSPFSLWQ